MKFLILLTSLALFCNAEWRQKVITVQTTVDHQMIPEYDTVTIKHYHKVDNKFYLITVDSTELWVDNIKELKK